MSHVFSSYLASLIQQLRITVLANNEGSKGRELGMIKQIQGVQDTLTSFTHKPELWIVYLANALLACLNLLTLFGLYSLRQSLVNWFLKNQMGHYTGFKDEIQPPQSERPHEITTFFPRGQTKTKRQIGKNSRTMSESQL